MPVKITLYAENIAVGTEIVNFALKVGGALSGYDINVEAPLTNGAVKTTYKRTPPDTLFDLDESVERSVANGSVRERVWNAVEKVTLPATRRQIIEQATSRCRKLHKKQVLAAVKFLIDSGILTSVTKTTEQG